jgi:hypothetical protein
MMKTLTKRLPRIKNGKQRIDAKGLSREAEIDEITPRVATSPNFSLSQSNIFQVTLVVGDTILGKDSTSISVTSIDDILGGSA